MANAFDPRRPFAGILREQQMFDAEQRAQFPEPSRVVSPDEGIWPPGFLPDVDGVRREDAEYLSSVRRCDDVVGAVLGVLEEIA